MVQSARSHQIARLEKELGTRLFDRTSRSVRLTAAAWPSAPSPRSPPSTSPTSSAGSGLTTPRCASACAWA
ncbi:LysR family transcriptional regulator [Streptomyces roseifaciens]